MSPRPPPLVRRPAPDGDVPGALPRRVLRQPRDARAARPPAVARSRRLASLRRGADRDVRRPHPAGHPGAAIERPTTASRSAARRRRRSASTTSWSPRTPTRRSRCSPTPTTRARVLGAIPYQRNEAVLHTDAALLPRRRRAWASWNYHLLDEPAGGPTVTYHMNRLQSLTAEREFCVTLNHADAIDPDKVIRTIPYAHPVSPVGRAARRHHEISGHAARTTAAPTGAGASTRTASRAARASRERERGRCDRQRPLRGAHPPPPHAVRPRVPLPRSRWPTSTSTSCLRLLDGRLTRAPGPRALAPRRLPRPPRTSARRRGPRRVEQRRRPPSRRADPAVTHLRPRPPLQPGVLLLLLRPRRRGRSRRRRRGHQHAVGRAPCVRAAAASCATLDKVLHVSPFMPMDQRYRGACQPRARSCRCTSRAARGGRAFDATLTLKRRR